MDETMLRTYLDGWSNMATGGSKAIDAMTSNADPDISFSDVNSPNVHTGHEGLRTIYSITSEKYPGATIEYRDLLFDGRNWSIRWTFSCTRPDGTSFGWRGASAGSVGEDGKVIEHTDYWSRDSINSN